MTSSQKSGGGRWLVFCLMVGFVLSSPTFALGADDASSPETSKASPGPAFRFAGEVGVERLEEDLYLPLALKFGADLPVPQLGCRWPGAEEGACETRLQFGLHTPVRLRISDRAPEQSGVLRDEDWDELGDYLRFVRFVSYGRPSKPVYARLGELGSLVLGHGTIVNGYYNVVTPDHYKLGLRASAETSYAGATAFVDHLVEPRLLGGRAYVRPWSWLAPSSWMTRLAMGASLVADLDAPVRLARYEDRQPIVGPERRPAIRRSRPTAIGGLDVELNVLDREVASITPYSDLNHHFGLGTGWHAGISSAVRFGGGDVQLSNRLEFRWLGPNYLPDYIGPLYEIHRYQFPGWGQLLPAPKLQVAADAGRGRLLGGYGELTGTFFERVTVSGGYANYQGPDNGSLRLRLQMTPIERLQVGFFYVKQHFETVDALFDRRGTLLIGEGRLGIAGPVYLKGAYSLLWHLRDNGSYAPVRRWNVGAGASIAF